MMKIITSSAVVSLGYVIRILCFIPLQAMTSQVTPRFQLLNDFRM